MPLSRSKRSLDPVSNTLPLDHCALRYRGTRLLYVKISVPIRLGNLVVSDLVSRYFVYEPVPVTLVHIALS